MPFAPIANFRKFARAGKAVVATLLADCIGGIKIENEFHKRNAYSTIADDKCAAKRYCETRGMSFGPSKFFGSKPDLTMYQPSSPLIEILITYYGSSMVWGRHFWGFFYFIPYEPKFRRMLRYSYLPWKSSKTPPITTLFFMAGLNIPFAHIIPAGM